MLGTREREKESPFPRHIGGGKEQADGKQRVGMGKEASGKAWPKRKMVVVSVWCPAGSLRPGRSHWERGGIWASWER